MWISADFSTVLKFNVKPKPVINPPQIVHGDGALAPALDRIHTHDRRRSKFMSNTLLTLQIINVKKTSLYTLTASCSDSYIENSKIKGGIIHHYIA